MKNKRLNTVTWEDKTYTAPAGYVFLNIGDEIKKGDSVFCTYSNSNQTIEDSKYTKLTFKNIQSIHMIPSIRKIRVRKVGPAIPDGYRIIKKGEIIPTGYRYILGQKGSKDIKDYSSPYSTSVGKEYQGYSDSIYIAPIIPPVPPAPKKYNLELTADQVKILSILLNNTDKTLNNWFNQSDNYYIEKSPELIEAADNEFKKAGFNENCIWNKLYKITKDNTIDFRKK